MEVEVRSESNKELLDFEDDIDSSPSDDDVSIVSLTSKKSKKRVQFQADDNLELVYEIPPRGHYSSDTSDSDSADENDLPLDSTESTNDNDVFGSLSVVERSQSVPPPCSSPSYPPQLHRKYLHSCDLTAGKGSYSVSKPKKTSTIVAKITGVNPFPPCTAFEVKGLRAERTERKPKRTKIVATSSNHSDERQTSPTRNKPKLAKRRLSARYSSPKRSKESNKSGKKQNQNKNDSASRIPNNQRTQSAKCRPTPKLLHSVPSTKYPSPPVSQSLDTTSVRPSLFCDNIITSAVRSMTIETVYTMDGFIFPRDPAEKMSRNVFEEPDMKPFKEVSHNSMHRKRCLSWQMANPGVYSSVLHTPCILPMWESVQSVALTSKPVGIKSKS